MTALHDKMEMNDIEMDMEVPVPASKEVSMVNVPDLFDEQPTALTGANLTTDAKISEEDEKENRMHDEDPSLNITENINLLEQQAQNAANANIIQVEKRTRKKKKLIVDEVKEIDSTTMKNQLSDTNAILGSLELAPPTRKLMQLKESGGIDKLFLAPSRPINSRILTPLFVGNMVTSADEDFGGKKKGDDVSEFDLVSKEKTGFFENIIAGDDTCSFVSVQERMRDQSEVSALANNELLPLADSFVEAGGDVSKQVFNAENLTLDGTAAALKDVDASGVNVNLSADKLISDDTTLLNPNFDENLEENRAAIEVTPGASEAKKKRRSTVNNTSDIANETVVNENIDEANAGTLNKRAKAMIALLSKSFQKHANVGFFELTKRNGRKFVAQKFYSLLVLKKYEVIEVSQPEAFGDIELSRGEKFECFVDK